MYGYGYQYGTIKGGSIGATLAAAYKARVEADGGTYENANCLINFLNDLQPDFYNDASLIMYPSGYKATKIYSVKPTGGTGDLTVARASTKTYIDSALARQTAAADVMPVSYESGGCGKYNPDPQRTNLVLNSATLVTQNVTTTAQSYVISFEGTGTVTLSGTYAGSLVGTGATPADRVSLVFTATAGTLTLTVSGSVINAQVQAGAYPTSYIPTVGSTVTRTADASTTTGLSALFGQSEGTILFNINALQPVGLGSQIIGTINAGGSLFINFFISAAGRFAADFYPAGVYGFSISPATVLTSGNYKIAIAYKASDYAMYVNGVSVGTSANATALSTTKDTVIIGNSMYGSRSEVMLFQTRLANATLATLTT
tara:strand:- start:1186 stop:2301 length:1116 start_codon:yes stop_codon:yes gene_type:complete